MQAFQVVRLFIEQLEQHSEQMAQRASEQPSDSTGWVLLIIPASLTEMQEVYIKIFDCVW